MSTQRRVSRRRRRRRLPLFLTLFLLAALIGGGMFYLVSRRIPLPYSYETRRDRYASAGISQALPMFAKDLCVVDPTVELPDGGITAEAGGLFDVSGKRVICGRNMFETLYPASITKVMTALLAIEKGNMDDIVYVTDAAVINEAGASLAGIHPGDHIRMESLLYGLMIPSGNDAANAIAVQVSGSVEAFVEEMNQRAQELGATGTHFVNPNGLSDKAHYTTVYDLYLIFREALKYPLFREVISTPAYLAEWEDANGNPISKRWDNSNWYLAGKAEPPEGVMVIGGKTGTTIAAGHCLILDSGRTDAEGDYISVILKAPTRQDLYNNMTNIIGKIQD